MPIKWSGAKNLRVRIEVVVIAPADSNDIVPSTTSLTLNGYGGGSIPVKVHGDLDREPDQSASINLTFPLLGVLGNHNGRLTLRDDDHPALAVTNRNTLEDGSVDGGAFHIIRFSKAINQPTALHIRTLPNTVVPGRDFVAIDTIKMMAPHHTDLRIDVQLISDNVIDLDLVKRYFLIVEPSNPSDTLSSAVGTGRITDDDDFGDPVPAIIQMSGDLIPGSGNINGGCRNDFLPVDEPFVNPVDARFQLTIDRASNRPFEVHIFTQDSALGDITATGARATAGSDYVPLDRVFVFPAFTRSMVFTVRILDDGVTESDEFFHVEAVASRVIALAQPCEQNEGGAVNEVKIRGNIF